MQADANGMTRAFIAVDIPSGIKDSIINVAKRIGADGIKAVGIEQIHITLFFLGYMSLGQIEEVKGILSRLSYGRFGVSLCGVGSFSAERPRVIFARINNGAKELNDIYELLSPMLSKVAKLEERGFSPHVTLARLKRFDRSTIEAANSFISRYKNEDFGDFLCSEVRLKRSVLTSEGAVHSDIYVKGLG
jgi:2'-5' RNA ligase